MRHELNLWAMRPALCGFVLAFSTLALADDGWVGPAGGSVRLMYGHPSIRMVSERVNIVLPKGIVTATFVFKNEGKPTTVLMGFPEAGSGGLKRLKTDTNFRWFRSYVDGKRVQVTRVPELGIGANDAHGDEYKVWWTKKVAFRRGQTRRVTCQYSAAVGGGIYGDRFFEYVLHSGASWKGTIGKALVTVDFRDIGRLSQVEFEPGVWVRRGKRATTFLRDFEPSEDDDINIRWHPAFDRFRVNGQTRMLYKHNSWSPDAQLGGMPPFRVRDDVVIPIRAAAKLLGGKVQLLNKNRVRLVARGGWVEFNVGSHDAVSPLGRFRMPEPASYALSTKHSKDLDFVPWSGYDSIQVWLNATVRALGGRSSFDSRDWLHIALSHSP